jgi:hypothetical protein
MDGEVLRDDQWEKVVPFVPGGRKTFFSAVINRCQKSSLASSAENRCQQA